MFDQDATVQCKFQGSPDWIYEGHLGGLGKWLKSTDTKRRRNRDGTVDMALGADILVECTTSEGRHGWYPCIMAETDELAGALSVAVGFRVETGDGVTFWSRSQMLAASNRIWLSGIAIPMSAYRYGITEHAYAVNVAAIPKREHATLQQAVSDAMDDPWADSPWL